MSVFSLSVAFSCLFSGLGLFFSVFVWLTCKFGSKWMWCNGIVHEFNMYLLSDGADDGRRERRWNAVCRERHAAFGNLLQRRGQIRICPRRWNSRQAARSPFTLQRQAELGRGKEDHVTRWVAAQVRMQPCATSWTILGTSQTMSHQTRAAQERSKWDSEESASDPYSMYDSVERSILGLWTGEFVQQWCEAGSQQRKETINSTAKTRSRSPRGDLRKGGVALWRKSSATKNIQGKDPRSTFERNSQGKDSLGNKQRRSGRVFVWRKEVDGEVHVRWCAVARK